MLLKSLFSYIFTAQNQHGLHSPFVFDLYLKTIKNNIQSTVFKPIEAIRNTMSSSRQKLSITDFGAGSKVNKSNLREVRDIAKNSKKSPKLGRLFYRLIQRFEHKIIFDLGTSLGLTTLYLASANAKSQVITFEGCPQTAAVAQQNFKQLDLKNIQTVVGNIDETLPKQILNFETIDFAFFDANHRYEPTIRYFETCLQKAHENSLFVFDDIHWSIEMETAWQVIKAHPSVSVTIDLFWVGLVFFRKKQPKQDFVLRFDLW
jgi:predicted O-methyltransferase YrrM